MWKVNSNCNYLSFLFFTLCSTALPHFLFVLALFPAEYNTVTDKRLSNVIKTVKTYSTFHCTTWCSMTEGCLAVNVIGNHDINCELTTGLSNEDQMEDADNSELLVLGKICLE